MDRGAVLVGRFPRESRCSKQIFEAKNEPKACIQFPRNFLNILSWTVVRGGLVDQPETVKLDKNSRDRVMQQFLVANFGPESQDSI